MGARDLLAELAGVGITIEANADMLVVRPASKLTDDLRAALRAVKPELLMLLAPATSRPYRLTRAEAEAAHAEPWDDAACARFVARVALFLRRGLDATDADDLAERLHLRDVQGDDRRLCLECRHLSGRAGEWRCNNHRQAGVARELPATLTLKLQRCPGIPELTRD